MPVYCCLQSCAKGAIDAWHSINYTALNTSLRPCWNTWKQGSGPSSQRGSPRELHESKKKPTQSTTRPKRKIKSSPTKQIQGKTTNQSRSESPMTENPPEIPKSLFVCAIDPLLSLGKFQSLTNNSFINATLPLYSNCTQAQTSSLPISSQTSKCPHYQMHFLLHCLQYSHHLPNEVPLSGQS